MSVRSENPLAYAVGFFVGAVVADLCLIGGEVLGFIMGRRARQ